MIIKNCLMEYQSIICSVASLSFHEIIRLIRQTVKFRCMLHCYTNYLITLSGTTYPIIHFQLLLDHTSFYQQIIHDGFTKKCCLKIHNHKMQITQKEYTTISSFIMDNRILIFLFIPCEKSIITRLFFGIKTVH